MFASQAVFGRPEQQPAKKHSWQYHGSTHLKVRKCGVETDTPIDKAIRAVYDPFLV